MNKIFQESDFINEPKIFQESDFMDETQVPDTPQKALLTNEPVGFLGSVNRAIPAMAGAGLGAAAGIPFGPLGVAGGAAIGGFGGEIWRQAAGQVRSMARGEPYTPAAEAIKKATQAGAEQFAGEVGGALLGAGYRTLSASPGLKQFGAQVLRAGPAIPERVGKFVLNEPNILSSAMGVKEAGKEYIKFEEKNGLKGLFKMEEERGSAAGSQELINTVEDIAKMLRDGAEIPTQDLYVASQAANRVALLSKFQDPIAANAAASGHLFKDSELIDAALESKLAEAPGMAREYAKAKAAQHFQSWLPQNKNLSPNVLRTWSAGVMAAKGISEGHPSWLLGLPMISPRVAGYTIRGVDAVLGYGKSVSSAIPRGLGFGLGYAEGNK